MGQTVTQGKGQSIWSKVGGALQSVFGGNPLAGNNNQQVYSQLVGDTQGPSSIVVSPQNVAQTAATNRANGGGLPTNGGNNTGGNNSAATSAAINGSFAPITANYDAMIGDLDRSRDQNLGNVYGEYNTSHAGLDLNHNQGNENLDRSQSNVDTGRVQSLDKLGKNVRASYDSRLRTIGNAGGGSSGANAQLALALHGVQQDQRTDIVDQSAKQSGEIALNRKHMDESFQQALSQLENWKNSQISSIVSNYQTQRGQIDRERAGADGARQRALASQSTALAQQAAAQLAQVQQGYKGVIGQFNVDRGALGGINSAADQIGKTNYDVRPFEGYDPAINYGGGPGQQNFFQPVAPLHKPEDDPNQF